MWLKELKIALIEKDLDKFSELVSEIPELETQREIEEALALLQQATQVAQDRRDAAADTMAQIRKNLTFLRSTQGNRPHKFDIKS